MFSRIVSLFAVYVDNFVIGSDTELRELWILEKQKQIFKIKELGIPELILEISLNWVVSSSILTNRFFDHIYLSVLTSVQALLDMMPGGVSSVRVNCRVSLVTLSKAMCIPEEERDAQDEDMQAFYRSAVGLLIWIQ